MRVEILQDQPARVDAAKRVPSAVRRKVALLVEQHIFQCIRTAQVNAPDPQHFGFVYVAVAAHVLLLGAVAVACDGQRVVEQKRRRRAGNMDQSGTGGHGRPHEKRVSRALSIRSGSRVFNPSYARNTALARSVRYSAAAAARVSFSARKRSASKAAIQPMPADVTA